MLNGTLLLHGEDAERLATLVCQRWCQRTRTPLNRTDTEDLIAYLIGEAWRVSEKFTPEKTRQTFRQHCYSILYFRCTDWLREDEGRTVWQFAGHTYQRERPQVLSLDVPVHTDGESLGATLGTPDVDPGEHLPTTSARMEFGGNIPASSYFPDRSLSSSGRTPRPSHRQSGRHDHKVNQAA